MAFSLEAAKWLCAITISILTFTGTSLPLCIKARKWIKRLESLAGGVFLGAGFAHLLEDSMDEISQYGKLDYPISGALAVSTFVVLSTVEIFSYSEHDHEDGVPKKPSSIRANENTDSNSSIGVALNNIEEIEESRQHDSSMHPHHSNDNTTDVQLNQTSNMASNLTSPVTSNLTSPKLFSSHFHSLSIPSTSLFLIMLIHSIIEGLALGIMKSTSGLIALVCAVGGHKPVEGFALGLIILKSRPVKWLYWLMMVSYSCITPIGIVIAIIISKEENMLALGILSAISAGTFTFVGCDEWSNMFLNKKTWTLSEKMWHLGLFIFGVLWMLLIAIVE